MSIEVIIFDLGKVVFDFDLNKLSEGLHLLSKNSKQDILDFVSGHKDIFANYEKGALSSREFYNRMSSLLKLNADYEKFCSIWNDIFTPFEDVSGFVKILSEKHSLAILSNTNDLHFEYLKNKYMEFFSYFKNFHLSYKIGSRKPEKEIYKKVIEFYNINPANIFFTDDLERNIIPAGELGISAYRFEGLKKLKKDLNSLGVSF